MRATLLPARRFPKPSALTLLVPAAAMVALPVVAVGQAGGVSPGSGVLSQPARPVRAIVTDALPGVTGVDIVLPHRSLPTRASLPPDALEPRRRGAGMAKNPGWPRIPDLPQVKSEIAWTNGVVSRAMEAEREREQEAASQRMIRPERRPTAEDLRRRAAIEALRHPSGADEARAPGEAMSRDEAVRAIREATLSSRRLSDRLRLIGSREAGIRHDLLKERGAGTGALRPAGSSGLEALCFGTGGALDGLPPAIVEAEPPVIEEPAPEPTKAEIGAAWLGAGDAMKAAAAYLAHVDENPDDVEALRSLGLALLMANKPAQGAELIARACSADPTLAERPVDPEAFGGKAEAREMVRRLVAHGQRRPAPEVWLSAAVLMQAQGRIDAARRMVDRATQAGLDPEVGAPLSIALKE